MLLCEQSWHSGFYLRPEQVEAPRRGPQTRQVCSCSLVVVVKSVALERITLVQPHHTVSRGEQVFPRVYTDTCTYLLVVPCKYAIITHAFVTFYAFPLSHITLYISLEILVYTVGDFRCLIAVTKLPRRTQTVSTCPYLSNWHHHQCKNCQMAVCMT
jgi:hypothetical protein